MASSIDASTSGAGGLITTADSSGILQLKSGGTTIATISSTGLQQNVGVPAFSAYPGSNQSVTALTWTKVQANTEEFDTNSNYDNATNYRFTPTVAGYYQVTGSIAFNGSALWAIVRSAIYKNGSAFKTTDWTMGSSVFSGLVNCNINALIYLNGSTDYIELWGYNSCASSPTMSGGQPDRTYFQAALIRSA